MNYRKNKSSNGITLITLIIMVIILLILTAVTFDIIIDGDFFGKAQNTVSQANAQIKNQEEQADEIENIWDYIHGKIIKSGTNEQTTIKLSAVTSRITKNSFRINARGTNANDDILTFTLVVKDHDQVFEEKTGEEVYWDVTGLEMNTIYEFTIIATDGESENSVTGTEITLTNNAPTISVAVSTAETRTTIKAKGNDSDGDILKYALTVKNQSGTSVVANYELDEQNEWTVTGLTANTTYSYTVTVSDGITQTTSSGTFKTLTDNSAPVIYYNYQSSKGTASFTITMSATDSDGDTLDYELYYKTQSSSSWTYGGTKTNITQGQNNTTTITVSGLSLNTTYDYKITVSDGNGGTATGTGTASTYDCAGYKYRYASEIHYGDWVDCESCEGGYVPCQGGGFEEVYNDVLQDAYECEFGHFAYLMSGVFECSSCKASYSDTYCSGCGSSSEGTHNDSPCEKCESSGYVWDSNAGGTYYSCEYCGGANEEYHLCQCDHGYTVPHDID